MEEGGAGSRGGGEKASVSVSCFKMAWSGSGESQGGGRMFARRCLLSRRANQSGIEALCGGLSGFKGPCILFSAHVHGLTHAYPWRGGVLMVGCSGRGTYAQQCQTLKALARNDGHEFHLAYESYLWRRQPRRKRQRHGKSAIMQCGAPKCDAMRTR